MDVYFFGDQTEDVDNGLKGLLSRDQDPILDAFFARSYDAIRKELSKTSKWNWKTPPHFTSLLDLLLRTQSKSRDIALDHALTTIYHLAVFIQYVPFPQ